MSGRMQCESRTKIHATLCHLLVDGALCWCFPRRNSRSIQCSVARAHSQSCFSSFKLWIYDFQIGQYVAFWFRIYFYDRKILVYGIFHREKTTVSERRFIFNFTKIKFKLFLCLAQNGAVFVCIPFIVYVLCCKYAHILLDKNCFSFCLFLPVCVCIERAENQSYDS